MTSVHYSSPEGRVDYIQGREIERRTFQSLLPCTHRKIHWENSIETGEKHIQKSGPESGSSSSRNGSRCIQWQDEHEEHNQTGC